MYRAQTICHTEEMSYCGPQSIIFAFLFFFLAGVLACLDGYMNIAIEQTEEYVNGQLKNKYGDAFLRGNNGKPDTCTHAFQCSKIHMHTLVMWVVEHYFTRKVGGSLMVQGRASGFECLHLHALQTILFMHHP